MNSNTNTRNSLLATYAGQLAKQLKAKTEALEYAVYKNELAPTSLPDEAADDLQDVKKALAWLIQGLKAQNPSTLNQALADAEPDARAGVFLQWVNNAHRALDRIASGVLAALYSKQVARETEEEEQFGLGGKAPEGCASVCDIRTGSHLGDFVGDYFNEFSDEPAHRKGPMTLFVYLDDGSVAKVEADAKLQDDTFREFDLPVRVTRIKLERLRKLGEDQSAMDAFLEAESETKAELVPLNELGKTVCGVVPVFADRPEVQEACEGLCDWVPWDRKGTFANQPSDFYPNGSGEVTFVNHDGERWWLGGVDLWVINFEDPESHRSWLQKRGYPEDTKHVATRIPRDGTVNQVVETGQAMPFARKEQTWKFLVRNVCVFAARERRDHETMV